MDEKIIMETCPECGHPLTNMVLTSNPPIPKKQCNNCGWSWTGKRPEIEYQSFRDSTAEEYESTNNYIDSISIISDAEFDNIIKEYNQVDKGKVVIDICPQCRNVLLSVNISSNPQVKAKHCYQCGWHWDNISEYDDVEYKIFDPDNGG